VEIVGNGFLARHLSRLAERHPGVVAVAAGVSTTSSTEGFDREAALVAATAERCRATGRRLLLFSTASAAVYGDRRPGRESDPGRPRNLYGAHKLGLERLVRESGAGHLVLRLAHVAGPGQPAHQLVPTLVRHLRRGRIDVQRDATRDLIGVDDVVTLIDGLLGLGLSGETVNVASGHAVPVPAIVDHLERRLDVTAWRHEVDGGTAHLVSIETLTGHLPAVVARLGFGPDYYRSVLDAALDGVLDGVLETS
jgi:NDP-hexose 4-ketoreductase